MKDELRDAAMKWAWKRWEDGWTIQDQYDTVWDAGYEAGKPKWIPIRSAADLPTKTGWYLVTTTKTGTRTVIEALFKDGEFHERCVIAWQPLPEPYTEGE